MNFLFICSFFNHFTMTYLISKTSGSKKELQNDVKRWKMEECIFNKAKIVIEFIPILMTTVVRMEIHLKNTKWTSAHDWDLGKC